MKCMMCMYICVVGVSDRGRFVYFVVFKFGVYKKESLYYWEL